MLINSATAAPAVISNPGHLTDAHRAAAAARLNYFSVNLRFFRPLYAPSPPLVRCLSTPSVDEATRALKILFSSLGRYSDMGQASRAISFREIRRRREYSEKLYAS